MRKHKNRLLSYWHRCRVRDIDEFTFFRWHFSHSHKHSQWSIPFLCQTIAHRTKATHTPTFNNNSVPIYFIILILLLLFWRLWLFAAEKSFFRLNSDKYFSNNDANARGFCLCCLYLCVCVSSFLSFVLSVRDCVYWLRCYRPFRRCKHVAVWDWTGTQKSICRKKSLPNTIRSRRFFCQCFASFCIQMQSEYGDSKQRKRTRKKVSHFRSCRRIKYFAKCDF